MADFRTVAWRKLCLNVAGGAITALTDRTLGVMRRPEVAEVARGLIRECIAVGRAEGAILEEALAEEIVESMIRGLRMRARRFSPTDGRDVRSK